jgi:hypothetical protein
MKFTLWILFPTHLGSIQKLSKPLFYIQKPAVFEYKKVKFN